VGSQTTTSKDNAFLSSRRLLAKIKSGKVKVPPHVRRNLEQSDFGANFITSRHEYQNLSKWFNVQAKAGYTSYGYTGPFSAVGVGEILPNSPYWPRVTPPSDEYLFALGGTAVNRCIPTHPAADLATVIGELREGLPSMVGKNLLTAGRPGKAVGGEYLNYQFGIKPLLADIRKLNEAVVKSDLITKQFLRDSGRLIRRRYTFPITETEETTVIGTGKGLYPTLPTQMYYSLNSADYTGTLSRTRRVTIESWFSGGFTYFVDFDADTLSRLQKRAQEVRRIYGVRLTPDVAWNLAPWSWAVDWFTNIGDLVENASRFSQDGLVMRYGYLMYKETIEDTYTHSGVRFRDGTYSGPVSQVFTTVYKRRVKAHPYGFGLTEESLSPRQLAILAALGISRGRD